MKHIWKAFAAVLIFTFLCSMALAETPGSLPGRQEEAWKILVMETSDIHGYIMDASSGREETFQYRLAAIAHLVREARASGQYDDVVLLDAGDLFQGTPVSGLTGGAAIRAAMDMMDYDAIALGNHEFDWDVTQYAADQEGTIAPYELGDYFGDAKTPILASNLLDAATGDRVPFTRDYVILEKAGKKIAVVGYVSAYEKSIKHEKIAPYRIDPDTDRLSALIRRVRETEKPDAVIVLAHADAETLAEQLDPSLVDLVAGGHSHLIRTRYASNGIPYIQAHCYGNGIVSAVMTVAPDGEVTVSDMNYIRVTEDAAYLYDTPENAAHLAPDIMELSHATWEAVQEEMNEVLGYTDTPIEKARTLGGCSAGNWLTGLMLRATADEGAIMAFYNVGGIRTSLLMPEGQARRDITVYDIYTISPFGNSLLLYDINGPELAELLRQGLNVPNFGDQMTGLSFTYTATGDADTPRNEREFTIQSITLDDGTEVDMQDTERLYRVCTTDFNATYPDSVFEDKEPLVPIADAPMDNDAFIALLRRERDAGDGYIPVDTRMRGTDVTETPGH